MTLRNSLYFFCSLLLWQSCGLFSFSNNVSLSADIHTFSIQRFHSEVSDGPLNMVEKLTEALETKIVRMLPITSVEKDGDIQYEGVIKSFSYATAFSSSDDAGVPKQVKRLTIAVEVSYENRFDEEASFKKKIFSSSEDMNSSDNQSKKELELVDKIFSDLVDKIFSKSVDLW